MSKLISCLSVAQQMRICFDIKFAKYLHKRGPCFCLRHTQFDLNRIQAIGLNDDYAQIMLTWLVLFDLILLSGNAVCLLCLQCWFGRRQVAMPKSTREYDVPQRCSNILTLFFVHISLHECRFLLNLLT